jgi:hypothetical protein
MSEELTSLSGMATKKKTTAKKKAAPKKAAPKKAASRKISSKTTTVVKKGSSVNEMAEAVANIATIDEVREVANAIQKTSLGKRIMGWFKSQAAR